MAQSRGADPSIRTEDYDPYLNPGNHLPIDIACEDETVRAKLLALDEKYAATGKVRASGDHLDLFQIFPWTFSDLRICTHSKPEALSRSASLMEATCELPVTSLASDEQRYSDANGSTKLS